MITRTAVAIKTALVAGAMLIGGLGISGLDSPTASAAPPLQTACTMGSSSPRADSVVRCPLPVGRHVPPPDGIGVSRS